MFQYVVLALRLKKISWPWKKNAGVKKRSVDARRSSELCPVVIELQQDFHDMNQACICVSGFIFFSLVG